MIQYSLKQLEYFVAAARLGNVTEAAAELHVSQPSVSMAISHLEDVIGASLMVRNPGRGVTLTAAGRDLLKKAEPLLASARQLADMQHRQDRALSGSLAIGCYRELAPYYLPRMNRAFLDRHPRCSLNVLDGDFDDLPQMLRDGRADMVMGYDLGFESGVERTVLTVAAPVLMVPENHALAGHQVLSLRDMIREPLILHDIEYSREFIQSMFHQQGLQPEIAMRTKSFEMQRSLVANGFGVAVTYTRPESRLSYDGKPLTYVPLQEGLPKADIILASWPGRAPGRIAREYGSFAENFFARDYDDHS